MVTARHTQRTACSFFGSDMQYRLSSVSLREQDGKSPACTDCKQAGQLAASGNPCWKYRWYPCRLRSGSGRQQRRRITAEPEFRFYFPLRRFPEPSIHGSSLKRTGSPGAGFRSGLLNSAKPCTADNKEQINRCRKYFLCYNRNIDTCYLV